jgi:hypothetical protein
MIRRAVIDALRHLHHPVKRRADYPNKELTITDSNIHQLHHRDSLCIVGATRALRHWAARLCGLIAILNHLYISSHSCRT